MAWASRRYLCNIQKYERLKLGFRQYISTISGGNVEFGKKVAALWGNGDYGRLGCGNLESQWKPRVLNSSAFDSQSLRDIACGGAHTLFLAENGSVYATGLNDFGQLGTHADISHTLGPVLVGGLPKQIVQISAGYHHSSAVTVDGELYMWGKNSKGQLGLGKKAATVVPQPSIVQCLKGVTIRIASLGFEHSVAITDQGEVLSWGGGASGRLGHGHKSSILGFIKMNIHHDLLRTWRESRLEVLLLECCILPVLTQMALSTSLEKEQSKDWFLKKETA